MVDGHELDTPAHRIVLAVANCRPIVGEDEHNTCRFCGRHQGPNEPGTPPHHNEHCLWVLANEWIASVVDR